MSDVDLTQLAIDRDKKPNSRMQRHLFTRYVFPLMLVLGFLSLVAWASRDMVFPPKSVTVVPVLGTHAEVRREGTPLFKAAGWIEPRPTPVRVAALAPGVVEQLLVVEDQPVKKGDLIAILVKDDAKLAQDRALIELKLREAELEEANANLIAANIRLEKPVHLEAALGEAEAPLAKVETQLNNLPFELRRAKANYESAQKNYDGKIAAKGVVSGVQIELARSKAESTKALVEELRSRASSLTNEKAALSQRRDAMKTQLELLTDEKQMKAAAEAKVKAAMARVEQALVVVAEKKLQLTRMTIKSPIDGRVFRLFGHPGARVGSGTSRTIGYDSSTIVTLYRPEMLQVRVDVRFEDIPKVSLNQSVEIGNPALSTPLTGKVLFVSSEADIQKNTLQVKVAIPNPPSVFKPEMLVDVTFLAPKLTEDKTKSSKELKIYIPKQFIQRDDGEAYVWVADQSAKVARKTSIETGIIGSDGLVEIIKGLTITSQIIVTGTDDLQDGDRIRITGEGSSDGTNRLSRGGN